MAAGAWGHGNGVSPGWWEPGPWGCQRGPRAGGKGRGGAGDAGGGEGHGVVLGTGPGAAEGMQSSLTPINLRHTAPCLFPLWGESEGAMSRLWGLWGERKGLSEQCCRTGAAVAGCHHRQGTCAQCRSQRDLVPNTLLCSLSPPQPGTPHPRPYTRATWCPTPTQRPGVSSDASS